MYSSSSNSSLRVGGRNMKHCEEDSERRRVRRIDVDEATGDGHDEERGGERRTDRREFLSGGGGERPEQ
ncbi:hypothetical protein RB195_013104 [Necator americanus]|uniref:Uncharacterized protein n=1 Tax=Necator americanus TaxID=51031 RepID=A0ABR1DU14_NECAM